jgi:hypothetical protein
MKILNQTAILLTSLALLIGCYGANKTPVAQPAEITVQQEEIATYRWKSYRDREKRDGIEWDLETTNSDSHDILKGYKFSFNNYPRNYEEFKKAMDGMAEKIKEKAGNK